MTGDRRLGWGAAVLGLLVLTAGAAPWLGLRDPEAQPDGLVLRDLPPMARTHAILLADGGRVYADEIRPMADGGVEYRRGRAWTRLDPAALAGADPEDWHRRPLYVLGTDAFGRDLLSRLVHGARVSVAVGLLAALLAVAAGGGLGLLAALGGKVADAVVMRTTDVFLAVPRLFLVLFVVALFRPSLAATIVVIGLTGWMAAARLVRGELLSLREREYVQAARGAGAPLWRVALTHLLPGALPPLLVEGTLRVAQAILLEASLSFLGLGVPPPAPSWGNLIADGRDHLVSAWWVSTFPGLAIAATVLALGLVGDGLRDRLDRRTTTA